MKGLLNRMGQTSTSNLAISKEALKELMTKINQKYDTAEHPQDNHMWAMIGAVCTGCYGGSLRGHDIFITDLLQLVYENDISGLKKFVSLKLSCN